VITWPPGLAWSRQAQLVRAVSTDVIGIVDRLKPYALCGRARREARVLALNRRQVHQASWERRERGERSWRSNMT